MPSTSDTEVAVQTVADPPPTAAAGAGATRGADYVWALTRLCLGWLFLWSFLDKTFGLGVDTPRAESWINGASPTSGFLNFGTSGPLAGLFQPLVGAAWVDWLYMTGLLGLGIALVLGIGLRIAAIAGLTLLALIWTAQLWPERNPFMDHHIVYALVLVGLALGKAGDTWGLGRWWSSTDLVQRFPLLR